MAVGSDSRGSGDAVLLAVEDGIATITLNRPERRNAVDYEGWKLLRSTDRAVSERDDVRVVVITGAGDAAFLAGADIPTLYPCHCQFYGMTLRRTLSGINVCPLCLTHA